MKIPVFVAFCFLGCLGCYPCFLIAALSFMSEFILLNDPQKLTKVQMDDSVVEFGEEDFYKKKTGIFRRPTIVTAHLLFRCAAVVIYVFSTSFTTSFIVSFLLIVSLLSIDFWTVKNISGRLLVGLRWWNFVDGEGNSHWRFESRKDQSRLNNQEVAVFWAALIAVPVVWCLLAFIAMLHFSLSWLIVCLMAISMSGANLYGYLRCKWNSSQEFSSFLSQKLFTSVLSRAATQQTTPSSAPRLDMEI